MRAPTCWPSLKVIRFVLSSLFLFAAVLSQAQTLPIWTGVAPGSENWTQKERQETKTPLGTVMVNVVTPTLTVSLPDAGKATGTGIIVAPGGAFARWRSISKGTALLVGCAAIPAQLPPMFMAWAQDDKIAGDAVVTFYYALRAAGNRPEAHIFSAGGHGFGMRAQGTTSDHWIDEFWYWLKAQGLTRPAAK